MLVKLILLDGLGLLLLLPAFPLAAELLLLSFAAALPARKPAGPASPTQPLRLGVVVPAHNEARLIAACVGSLHAAAIPAMRIYVVAHNCTDDTADRAEAAGATVLRLNEDSGHGKGAALDHGFGHAMADGCEGLLVIDADSVVSQKLPAIVAAALVAGSAAVQCRYLAANAEGSTRTRLMAVALLGMNVLRPRGRSRLGLSCGIFGNGFALRAATLRKVPYAAHSLVEDLEYHLLLLEAGLRVDFLDDAEVRGEMPTTGTGAATQRARWEGGRQRMRRQWTGPLLRRVLLGRLRLLEPLFDLRAVPLATGTVLMLAALLVPMLWVRAAAGVELLGVLLYVAVSAALGDDPAGNLKALAGAPFYIAFKIAMIGRTRRAARTDAAWVRTQRNDDSPRNNGA